MPCRIIGVFRTRKTGKYFIKTWAFFLIEQPHGEHMCKKLVTKKLLNVYNFMIIIIISDSIVRTFNKYSLSESKARGHDHDQ